MFYFNKVSPSPLRVEADEVTYHFHIMLRFEIEKGLIEGKLKVKDLPEIWNIKMKEYLGIKPKDYSDGVLQDVHWSNGMVGYFPTYSLGTFLGAQWEQKLSNGRISKLASRKLDISEYVDIEKWLREHIHKYGSTYTLQDLLAKNKMKFDPKVNLKYLEEKYRKIYGF
jgi:carboxypeptidase Taq